MNFLMMVAVGCVCAASLSWAEISLPEIQAPRTDGVPPVQPPPAVVPVPLLPVRDGDQVRFLNGDVLHGTIHGASPSRGLLWRRGDVKDPITFALGAIGELWLAPRSQPGGNTSAVVELTNGDALPGEVIGLDDQTLTLQTWYAGKIAIKRAMLQRVAFVNATTAASYTGPNDMAEWKSGDGNRSAWSLRKGALQSLGSGSVGCNVKLPADATIEFDLAWRGRLYFQAGFGFEDVSQIYNSGGYMLQMSYSSIYLQRHRPRQGSENMGRSTERQDLQRKNRLRVALKASQTTKMIALFLDGTLVKQWTESDQWVAKGSNLVFVAQDSSEVRVSNLSVTSWDGRLDVDPAPARDSDLLRLQNGDKVSGTLQSIRNGQVVFTASFAEMTVPQERIGTIEFASQKSERARRHPDDVRAFFADGRRVTLGLEKLEEQSLTGTSENFGRVTAATAAFRRVQFHIYERNTRPGSPTDDWSSDTGEDE